MDSDLRKKTIFGMIALVLCVIGIVLLINRDVFLRKNENGQTGQEETQVITETYETDSSGQISGSDLSAFLSKEGFFDEEDPFSGTIAALQDETISLIVTSEERDIRIRVVDEAGEIVTGLPVEITIEGLGVYKDLDRDGIVQVTGVETGVYYVSLGELEGYRTNANFVSVTVKARADHRKMEDIDYLITMENDLISVQSDGRISLASSQETDKQQEILTDVPNAGSGVRITSKDRNVDFYLLKSAGVSFVILRVGYRGYANGNIYADASFEQYYRDAVAAGLKVGVVFESQAINHMEAVEEASAALTLIEGCDITYPVMIDIEPADGQGRADGLDLQTRTEICEAFLETVQNEGYPTGVEGSLTSMTERIATEALVKYHLCVDDYDLTHTYSDGSYQLWQYTGMGSIPGMPGLYDLMLSYLGY